MAPTRSELQDGSRIAVIGGGPAGSFFAYFAKYFSHLVDMELEVDIYEPKAFDTPGPKGCNHCGGIISESLIQMLSTEGIVLPANVIRRGIESYTLHLEDRSVEIETPKHEQRIAAVYRGFGPKGYDGENQRSFDGYMLKKSVDHGARLINSKVTSLERVDEGIELNDAKGSKTNYDLVVGAVGLNPFALKLFTNIQTKYIEPKITRTHICEFHMEPDLIDKYFGNSMHVFLINMPKVKFGALIPKENFITLVLLGEKIDKQVVQSFLNHPSVVNCFPPESPPSSLIMCQCYPSINIAGAKFAFADNLILIGDSSSSKLYKNGIGSAYETAKAAARTAVFEGISEEHFTKHYEKICRNLDSDNDVGKLIFGITSIIQKSSLLKRGLLKTVQNEQQAPSSERYMSAILWDTFTGSASYKNILKRGVNPKITASLLSNSIF